MTLTERIKSTIREVPDFPKAGILFKDITPLLQDPGLCRDIVAALYKSFCNDKIDAIIGIESRGFLFGMMLAEQLNIPFITVRKKGKLPYKTISYAYELEYGTAEMEMHIDALNPGWRVLIHDDLLATGGTAAAAAELCRMQNAEVAGFAFVVELGGLGGMVKLAPLQAKIVNLVSYQ